MASKAGQWEEEEVAQGNEEEGKRQPTMERRCRVTDCLTGIDPIVNGGCGSSRNPSITGVINQSCGRLKFWFQASFSILTAELGTQVMTAVLEYKAVVRHPDYHHPGYCFKETSETKQLAVEDSVLHVDKDDIFSVFGFPVPSMKSAFHTNLMDG
ncbi:hypothetical protein STEG23_010787 [Scotinomys teguina]